MSTVFPLPNEQKLCYDTSMRADLLSYLACPECQAGLALVQDSAAAEIEEGLLKCAGCASEYPIENGIPRLMPREILDAQKSEIAARDAQVADYDAMWFLNLFGAVEMPMTLRRLQISPTDAFLEAGCGTGRMTQEFAAKAREVVAIDFSFQSLCVNRKKVRQAGVTNVHLVQADLCKLPFKKDVFDRATSCQVLEHVPTHPAREEAVRSISRVLKPGSTFVTSAYQHTIWTRQKEGQHEGGIPFFRFTRSEFQSLLASAFRVESITGALVYLHLARCTNLT
jgi:ubiquinone/menaquinone biosynthesis C-methylase UbiE/uncharacterized protein YbaR (Trm112 family)